MSRFYAHIVEIESLIIALDELDLSTEQKSQLAELVDSTIHHTVLDIIFSKLSEEDKAVFAARLQADPDDEQGSSKKNKELMKFVNDKVEGIEDEITEAVRKLKEELHEDIKEAKKR
ncbi:hypothetical protein A3A14_03360 [Candidatus Daviesbacteria bacterium RIFCSPLOWO2_01_FULL_43_38]|uniref:Uncharacterized protein n=2 Tax=Candidatus Daviesiibacteriota TaxID=1752718 RepID=A0A1F5K724_9BACT|nr:MAG: hypothetical protein UV41_C0070G0003 [Candidatus Daviesbacteria bacterium GW2011_GWA2_42_7]OGE20619.1 MAG: hypothetical protein A2874_01985 [Candidatus Daviesbacteria bacterium RIFCSPHIGHO2_01_FULL_43_17]OGE36763.1 MAG: hypothetical protein A3E45_01405 [Candidatus Daviesbacteria bacterium RIFCSPHIGHO2_12_FULL_43_11]OGE63681.1 MAG: hypothetical protein A3A14_03360 [Candidatus Daviesbacteria bacterium RIFCSPLOWO2_01_FULL_43_38]